MDGVAALGTPQSSDVQTGNSISGLKDSSKDVLGNIDNVADGTGTDNVVTLGGSNGASSIATPSSTAANAPASSAPGQPTAANTGATPNGPTADTNSNAVQQDADDQTPTDDQNQDAGEPQEGAFLWLDPNGNYTDFASLGRSRAQR